MLLSLISQENFPNGAKVRSLRINGLQRKIRPLGHVLADDPLRSKRDPLFWKHFSLIGGQLSLLGRIFIGYRKPPFVHAGMTEVSLIKFKSPARNSRFLGEH